MMDDGEVLEALLEGKVIVVDESSGKEYTLEGCRMLVRKWGNE